MLPPSTGYCQEPHNEERRWYYDDERGTCAPFIYAGCAGNQNNFRSYEACYSYCASKPMKCLFLWAEFYISEHFF